jgi:hypothetical protein
LAKYTGKGAKFQILTVASPQSWTDVAQIKEIGSATISSDEVDVTTLDANQSGLSTDYKDFLQGFKDPGEISLNLVFDPNLASHGTTNYGLYDLFDGGDTVTARIVFPVSPVNYLVFQGFFRDWETPTFNSSDPVESTFTMRIRQKPTLTTSATATS